MKIISRVLCVALLVMPFTTMAADESGCENVNWGQDVLAKFPNAQKACHGVTMKNGEAYAHYVAKVVANEKDAMTANLMDKDNKAIAEVKFVPNPDQKITIGGKETKMADIKKGTKLDLWIQHSRWGLYSDPDSSPMQILSRKDL